MVNNSKEEWITLQEKIGFSFSRLLSFPLVPPEHVYFSLTNRCNLNCKMCDISKDPEDRECEHELTFAEVKDIILQIKQLGVRHLIFSGGEPFLKSKLLDMVEFAKSSGIKMVDIITNGVLLSDDIIQRLIKIPLSHITVSLDGLKECNDFIRSEGMFACAERNIDKLNYYKAKKNSYFPSLGINFTIMNSNIGDMLPMVEFARLKKCNIIVFQPLLFSNTKMYEKVNSPLWPSLEMIGQLEEIIPKIIRIKHTDSNPCVYTDDAILKSLPAYFRGKRPQSSFKCYEGIKRIVITSDGKLWSCSGIYGDLKEKSLKSIWYSISAAKMRIKARKCKEHCLQDCVYFPSDVLNDTLCFLKNFNCIKK